MIIHDYFSWFILFQIMKIEFVFIIWPKYFKISLWYHNTRGYPLPLVVYYKHKGELRLNFAILQMLHAL